MKVIPLIALVVWLLIGPCGIAQLFGAPLRPAVQSADLPPGFTNNARPSFQALLSREDVTRDALQVVILDGLPSETELQELRSLYPRVLGRFRTIKEFRQIYEYPVLLIVDPDGLAAKAWLEPGDELLHVSPVSAVRPLQDLSWGTRGYNSGGVLQPLFQGFQFVDELLVQVRKPNGDVIRTHLMTPERLEKEEHDRRHNLKPLVTSDDEG